MSIIDNDVHPQQSKSESEKANAVHLNLDNDVSGKEAIVEIIETDTLYTKRAMLNPNESELIEPSQVEDREETVNKCSPATNEHPDRIIYISHINMDAPNNQHEHLESQGDVDMTVATTEGDMKNESKKPKRKKINKFYNPQAPRNKSYFQTQIIKYILLYVMILAFIIGIILIIIKFG